MYKYVKAQFQRHIIIILIIGMGLLIPLSLYPIFSLCKEQIMYLFSTIAQSISALYAMTIAGYAIFKNELTKSENFRNDPEGVGQNIEDLEATYKMRFAKLGIMTFATISLAIAQMILGDHYFLEVHFYENYLLNLGICIFIISLILILDFIIEIIDPNNLLFFGDRGQKEIETIFPEKPSESSPDEEEGFLYGVNNFETFFRIYNSIESIIIQMTDEMIKTHPNRFPLRTMKQRIDYLKASRIKMRGLIEEIDILRKYRNYLAHGTQSQMVPNKMIQRVTELQKALIQEISISDMYDIFVGNHMDFEEMKRVQEKLSIKNILSIKHSAAYQTIFRVQFNKLFNAPKECYEFLKNFDVIGSVLEKVKVVGAPIEYPSELNE